jgi:hypothetical protein
VNGLSPEELFERWGAADCREPWLKALLRAVGAAGLRELPAARPGEEDAGAPTAEHRTVYWALEGRAVVEMGAPLDPFLSDLLARWAGEDVAIWLDEGQAADGPRLVAVVRPDGRGEPQVTWL